MVICKHVLKERLNMIIGVPSNHSNEHLHVQELLSNLLMLLCNVSTLTQDMSAIQNADLNLSMGFFYFQYYFNHFKSNLGL